MPAFIIEDIYEPIVDGLVLYDPDRTSPPDGFTVFNKGVIRQALPLDTVLNVAYDPTKVEVKGFDMEWIPPGWTSLGNTQLGGYGIFWKCSAPCKNKPDQCVSAMDALWS